MSRSLERRGPASACLMPGTVPAAGAEEAPDLVIREIDDCALVQILAGKGRMTALRRRLKPVPGVTAPGRPLTAVAGNGVMLCATGPLELWALSETLDEAGLIDALAAAVGDAASLTGQSCGRAVVRLSGPRAPDVLAKGCPIDFHPRVFPTPGSSHTSIEKMPVLVVKRDDRPSFDLAVARSYAGSFVRWLTDSAQEFGYRVEVA